MNNLITRNKTGDIVNTFDDLFNILDRGWTEHGALSSSRLNVVTDENESEYIIKAEVPGIPEENVDVSFENDILSISAEYEDKGEKSLRRGKYSWACTVRDVDHEGIKADLNNGILNITLPKSERAKPRKIKIEKS